MISGPMPMTFIGFVAALLGCVGCVDVDCSAAIAGLLSAKYSLRGECWQADINNKAETNRIRKSMC
jgi:hypothetical protein